MQTLMVRPYTSSQAINKTRDREILKRILHGEKELIELLVRPYQNSIQVVVDFLMKDHDLHNVIYKASEDLSKFTGQTSFHAWLLSFVIAEANPASGKKSGLVLILKKELHLSSREISFCTGFPASHVKNILKEFGHSSQMTQLNILRK
jgi:hypothetical protein